MTLQSNSKPYVCEYCNTGYTREKTLAVHMCEQKRRHLQKDEKRVQLGFYAFNQFYKLSAGARKDKTYQEFCKSQYYNAFVKFGSFLNNVKPLYPEKYIDHVVTSGVKLDHWCKEELYEMLDYLAPNECVLHFCARDRAPDNYPLWIKTPEIIEETMDWLAAYPGENITGLLFFNETAVSDRNRKTVYEQIKRFM